MLTAVGLALGDDCWGWTRESSGRFQAMAHLDPRCQYASEDDRPSNQTDTHQRSITSLVWRVCRATLLLDHLAQEESALLPPLSLVLGHGFNAPAPRAVISSRRLTASAAFCRPGRRTGRRRSRRV